MSDRGMRPSEAGLAFGEISGKCGQRKRTHVDMPGEGVKRVHAHDS